MSNTTINSEELILYYFKATEESALSFQDLKKLRKEVEEANDYMFVDITYSSIRETITRYNFYLELGDSNINLVNKINFELEDVNQILKDKLECLLENK